MTEPAPARAALDVETLVQIDRDRAYWWRTVVEETQLHPLPAEAVTCQECQGNRARLAEAEATVRRLVAGA
jgi:hypothetical protein